MLMLMLYRFSSMVVWMDRIDESLSKMFKSISSAEEFEAEKVNFNGICCDVEQRKEDMKWLVQQLDQLVAHRYTLYNYTIHHSESQ